MASTDVGSSASTEMPEIGTIDMKLEAETLPVSDVDRAKRSPGPDPAGRSYFTFASFSDPDGNRLI